MTSSHRKSRKDKHSWMPILHSFRMPSNNRSIIFHLKFSKWQFKTLRLILLRFKSTPLNQLKFTMFLPTRDLLSQTQPRLSVITTITRWAQVKWTLFSKSPITEIISPISHSKESKPKRTLSFLPSCQVLLVIQRFIQSNSKPFN